MSELFEKLQNFLPMKVYQEQSEFEENVYHLYDAEKAELIGTYIINGSGYLSHFSLDGDAKTGSFQKEELMKKAEEFIRVFHPDLVGEFELSAILDLDNPYMFTYEKRDEKYGLFIHSLGFTVAVATNGQIQQFYYEEEDFEIIYPQTMLSEEEAIEKYMEHFNLELIVEKFEGEIYQNGDNLYHLSYSIVEHATEIPTDGSEPATIKEEVDIGVIHKQEVPQTDIYPLIGITSDYALLDRKDSKGKRIECWSRSHDASEFSMDMDEVNSGVIKLCFENGRLLQVTSGEVIDQTLEEKISETEARKNALDVLFKLFPDAHERFRIETIVDTFEHDEYKEMMEDIEYENEVAIDDAVFEDYESDDLDVGFDSDFEDHYSYYIYLMHGDIRVEQHVSVIGIGKRSGKVKYLLLEVLDENEYHHLPNQPTFTLEEAKKIYRDILRMELQFVKEYNEEQKAIYTLSYTPVFPKTVGHVRAIDAITGKTMCVDVGNAVFF